MNTARCLWCGEPLRWTERGWVHLTGGLYMQHCRKCGYRAALYPSPVRCPRCGAEEEWRDDHCALPDR